MRGVYTAVLLLLVQLTTLWASSDSKNIDSKYADRDMDGVIDRDDRCPGTPFFALVDRHGCTVKKLKVTEEQEETLRKILSQKD